MNFCRGVWPVHRDLDVRDACVTGHDGRDMWHPCVILVLVPSHSALELDNLPLKWWFWKVKGWCRHRSRYVAAFAAGATKLT